MDPGPEYESRLGNATVRMNGRMVGVAAGQILERGMLVTRKGPAVPAGPGAVRGGVGVLENGSDNRGGRDGDREVCVLGSGTVICVRAGADIGEGQEMLKAGKGGTVVPMEDGDDEGLWVASVRGNT
ncbi:MAG: hypothetical protein MPJ78_18765 [Hyphomicrobiaceae bacterium]|nr:hypothetical protein [Hyphomicrobiaceae bacterium]